MARLGRFIRARTISSAWRRGLNLIWRQGALITDQRGTRIKEILSLQIVVEDPLSDMIPAEYSWNEARLEEYAKELLSGDKKGFVAGASLRCVQWTRSDMLQDCLTKALRRDARSQ
jgi:thymidylate synthase